MPRCPICSLILDWTGSTESYAVYSCPIHGEKFHSHHDISEQKKHDHDGHTHV